MLDIKTTDIEGVLLLTPKRFADNRGHFVESWNRDRFHAAGVTYDFVQDNESRSLEKGTVRGLHYQAPPRAQAKLVRVAHGAVIDIAVDVRNGSPTFGKHVRALLSAENGMQILVPAGFLHGFATLEANTILCYKVTDFYSAAHDGAVLWNSPELGLDWGIDPSTAVLSEKDSKAPPYSAFHSPF